LEQVLSEKGRTLEALGMSGTMHLAVVAEGELKAARAGGCTTMAIMSSLQETPRPSSSLLLSICDTKVYEP